MGRAFSTSVLAGEPAAALATTGGHGPYRAPPLAKTSVTTAPAASIKDAPEEITPFAGLAE